MHKLKDKIGTYRYTFKKAKLFTLFLKTVFFLFKFFYKFFLPEPEPAVWVGAGQNWTGSTTLQIPVK